MSQTEGKTVLLRLKGDFVDIMCSVNEEFTPHVVCEKKLRFKYESSTSNLWLF